MLSSTCAAQWPGSALLMSSVRVCVLHCALESQWHAAAWDPPFICLHSFGTAALAAQGVVSQASGA